MSARKPQPQVRLSVPEDKLCQVFEAVSNFPRSSARPPLSGMELTKFHRLLRDLELYGPNLTTLDVDMIHIKCKPRGAKRLNLVQFGIALEMCAERLGISASDIVDKAIELGVPLPSAPPPAEWSKIPQQLLQHTQHCGPNCRCGREIHHVGWRLDEEASPDKATPPRKAKGPQAAPESLEDWQRIKEESEALRARYGLRGHTEHDELVGSASVGAKTRAAASPDVPTVSSESKASRRPRGTFGESPRSGQGEHMQYGYGDSSPANKPSADQVAPFVITENEASPPAQGGKDDGFQSSQLQNPSIDLFTAFSVFCSTSPHKEFEPGMDKSMPLMLQVEFRRMCRQCGLKSKVASAGEQPDMVFFIVASRAKSKYLDFDLFLSALERLALSCKLSFSEVERRVCATAEELASEWSEEQQDNPDRLGL